MGEVAVEFCTWLATAWVVFMGKTFVTFDTGSVFPLNSVWFNCVMFVSNVGVELTIC